MKVNIYLMWLWVLNRGQSQSLCMVVVVQEWDTVTLVSIMDGASNCWNIWRNGEMMPDAELQHTNDETMNFGSWLRSKFREHLMHQEQRYIVKQRHLFWHNSFLFFLKNSRSSACHLRGKQRSPTLANSFENYFHIILLAVCRFWMARANCFECIETDRHRRVAVFSRTIWTKEKPVLMSLYLYPKQQ
jgi:hypothetical protein